MGRGAGLRGKICVYCNERSSTRNGDHLLARSLLSVPARNGAPKLPCCEECNSKKAKLELYLASVLPLASRETDAAERAELAVAKVLKNKALSQSITVDVQRIRDPIDAGSPETIAFPFRAEILIEYSRLVSAGLFFWTTGTRVYSDKSIKTFFAEKDHDNAMMWRFLFNTDGVRVRGNIGGSGLVFEGLCNGPPHTLSVWRLSFLNGACFAYTDGRYCDAIWSFVEIDDDA